MSAHEVSESGDDQKSMVSTHRDAQAKSLGCCPMRHAVYGTLVRYYLCLYTNAHKAIMADWGIDDQIICRLGLVSIPTYTLNLLACQALAEKFGDLSDIPGFFRLRNCWRMDLDEELSGRGLILPIRNYRMQIVALRVFRHTQDQFPFILKTRTGGLQAA
jgi:hypothetical protein